MGKYPKWLSRKVILALVALILEILVATGTIPVEQKELLMKLIAAIIGGYITVEGVADIVSRTKTL